MKRIKGWDETAQECGIFPSGFMSSLSAISFFSPPPPPPPPRSLARSLSPDAGITEHIETTQLFHTWDQRDCVHSLSTSCIYVI